MANADVTTDARASRTPPLAAALKDAVLSGLVAFGLFFFMIGLRTEQGSTGALEITTRFQTFAILVAAVFVGSFLRTLMFGRGAIPLGRAVPPSVTRLFDGASRFAGPALLIFALLVPVLFYQNRYLLDLGILVLTYVMLGWGLNIVVGLAGLLDLGYVAFYAVGAYAFALLATTFGWSFWMCLPIAGAAAALWGCTVGLPVLRLRGDYLAIVTLAFAEIVRIVLINWTQVTHGPNGISDIPKPTFFVLPFGANGETFSTFFGLRYDPLHAMIFLYYVIFALAILTNLLTLRLRRLPIGQAWEAMREDEIACRSLGINTAITKLSAFATGAMFGGLAGAFFATRQGFISPESFTFMESATILAIVVLGGLGSQIGVALAAIVLVGGFEAMRNTQGLRLIFGSDFDPSLYRMLLFGIAMVAIMVWRPGGIVSRRTPSITLGGRRYAAVQPVAEGRA